MKAERGVLVLSVLVASVLLAVIGAVMAFAFLIDPIR